MAPWHAESPCRKPPQRAVPRHGAIGEAPRAAWMGRFGARFVVVLAALWSFGGLTAQAASQHKLPERYRHSPYSLMSLSVGHPNDGWQVRAKKLRNTRALKVRNKSHGRNYAHPALVLMLRRTAKDIASAAPGSVMLVGDLSFDEGGPISGHYSHQSGRDADIAFYVTDAQGEPVNSQRFVAFDSEGRAKDKSGLRFDDWRNYLLVEAWVKDRRAGISHIFVSRELRSRLLKYGRSQARFREHYREVVGLLKQPENALPHDDHFHVRISCPKRQEGLCKEHSTSR